MGTSIQKSVGLLLALALLLASIAAMTGCRKEPERTVPQESETVGPASTDGFDWGATDATGPEQTDAPAPTDEADPDRTDAPAPTDEAKPLTPAPGDAEIGDRTVSVAYIPFDEPVTVQRKGGYFDADLSGDTLYLLDGDARTLTEFRLDGEKASKQNETALNGSYVKVSVNRDGRPVLSKNVGAASVLEADGSYTKLEAEGPTAFSKTKDFGVRYYTNSDVCRIRNGKQEPWLLTDMANASADGEFCTVFKANVIGDHVWFSGNAFNDEGKRVAVFAVYDFDGNEIGRSRDKCPGNSYDCVNESESGFIAACNYDITLWDPDGTLIGTIGYQDLFDIGQDCFVEVKEIMKLDDGSFLVFAVASDDDSNRALLFRVEWF